MGKKNEKNTEGILVKAKVEYNDKYKGIVKPSSEPWMISKERYDFLTNPEKNCYKEVLVEKAEEKTDTPVTDGDVNPETPNPDDNENPNISNTDGE